MSPQGTIPEKDNHRYRQACSLDKVENIPPWVLVASSGAMSTAEALSFPWRTLTDLDALYQTQPNEASA